MALQDYYPKFLEHHLSVSLGRVTELKQAQNSHPQIKNRGSHVKTINFRRNQKT
jgi:hypothetical protein